MKNLTEGKIILSNERALRDWKETNHGFPRWARMPPSSWDWQKNDSALIETPLQLKKDR
jgi:hypothetical protein